MRVSVIWADAGKFNILYGPDDAINLKQQFQATICSRTLHLGNPNEWGCFSPSCTGPSFEEEALWRILRSWAQAVGLVRIEIQIEPLFAAALRWINRGFEIRCRRDEYVYDGQFPMDPILEKDRVACLSSVWIMEAKI